MWEMKMKNLIDNGDLSKQRQLACASHEEEEDKIGQVLDINLLLFL